MLSNLKDNQLNFDTNGIGYLNRWTFNKTYSRPIVMQMDGKNLTDHLISYNPSAFFGKGYLCCIQKSQIQFLSFAIGSNSHLEQEDFPTKELDQIVDQSKVILDKNTNVNVHE